MNDQNGMPEDAPQGAVEVDALPWERPATAPEREVPSREPLQPDEHSHFQEVKTEVHRKLLERLNLSNIEELNRDLGAPSLPSAPQRVKEAP